MSRIGTVGAVWLALGLVLALLWRRPSLLVAVAVSVGAADLLTVLIKQLVPRHRPFEHQLGPSERTHSFPSGHTATAFAGATVLSAYAPRYRIPLYALACLIGFSRLYNGVHYPTDVLAGAVLGAIVARVLIRSYTRTAASDEALAQRAPVSGRGAIALLLLSIGRRRSRRGPPRG